MHLDWIEEKWERGRSESAKYFQSWCDRALVQVRLYGHWCTGVTGGALPLPTHRLHIYTAQEMQRAPTAPLYPLWRGAKLTSHLHMSPAKLTGTRAYRNWICTFHSLKKKVPLIQIKDIKTFTSMFLLRNSLIKQLAVPAFGFLNHLCDKSF